MHAMLSPYLVEVEAFQAYKIKTVQHRHTHHSPFTHIISQSKYRGLLGILLPSYLTTIPSPVHILSLQLLLDMEQPNLFPSILHACNLQAITCASIYNKGEYNSASQKLVLALVVKSANGLGSCREFDSP